MMRIVGGEHPDAEVLGDYVRHRLAISEALEVKRHLLACNFCENTIEEMAASFERSKRVYYRRDALPFRTHLPLYGLAAAAGKFGEQQMIADPERWVEVSAPPGFRLTEDMFVIHVKGFSMEPSIPDGSTCVFKGNVNPPYEGRVVLLEQYGDFGGNRYAVKRYHASSNPDPHNPGDAAWLHERMTLESDHPNFHSLEIPSDRKVQVIGEFMFVILSEPPRSKLAVS